MDLMERIASRLAEREMARQRKRQLVKTRQNVAFNRYDRQMWDGIRATERVERDVTDLMVGDTHQGGQRKGYDNAPELLQDLSYLLYKADPRLVPESQVETDARLNRNIIEEVQASPYHEEIRQHTVLDDTCTTIAMQAIAEAVRELLLRNQEAAEQSNEDKANTTDEMNSEDNRPPGCSPSPMEDGEESEKGEGRGESDNGTAPTSTEPDEGEGEVDSSDDDEGDGESESGGEDEGEGDSDSADESDFDPDPSLDGEEHEGETDYDLEDLSQMINRAMQEAANEVGDLETLRRGIGLEDGEWRQMSPEQRLAMAERLKSPAMRELADMIGRMKRYALGQQAQKVSDVPHEPVSIKQGNELRHLLGSEYALLDDEDTEWEFYRRFADSELLQYQMRGMANAGKGPIVACIDRSTSMKGRPFTWALAVAESLRRICAEQERDFYALTFSTNTQRDRFSFPKGQAGFERVLEFLSVAATGGGTHFDGVLEEALGRVSSQFDEGLEQADIVFITDGRANLSDQWLSDFNEEKDRVGCRVFSVFIGGAFDMTVATRPVGLLHQFSDSVISVADLRVDAVGDIFATV